MENKLKLYGLKISYFTGKMEGYLRYKELPFEFVTLTPQLMRMLRKTTGAAQMPAVELPDGRVMTDTTPMIQWLERAYPQAPVIPNDPAQRFLALLLEDYADEWLWRPAMHYRWSYKGDRMLLARNIVDELMPSLPGPAFLKRATIRRRQWGKYVKQDGVDANTWDHVESIYLNTLDQLESIFSMRPYVLGDQPTVADFGFFASMFRHFGQDPTAAAIMRQRAPGVFAWQGRLWNARASAFEQSARTHTTVGLAPVFDAIAAAYLPYLNDNARAWQQGAAHFDPLIEGVQYRNIPVSQYRVWCLEQLQHHARNVPESAAPALADALGSSGCLDVLFELEEPRSRYAETAEVPFSGRKVHYHNRQD